MGKKKETESVTIDMYRTRFTIEHENILDEIYEKELAINTMTKELKPLKKFIQEEIGDYEGLVTDKYIVNYKKEEATTFETARFKEDYPKLYEQFTKIGNRRKWIVDKK